MALKKKDREKLKQKYGGRCAYCGQELGDRWHADHIEPVDRKMICIPGKGLVSTSEMHKPENDHIDNMNPSCAPCNIDKHSLSLESWRSLMQASNEVLLRDVSTFRRAVRCGLVELKNSPIVFYFEKLERDAT